MTRRRVKILTLVLAATVSGQPLPEPELGKLQLAGLPDPAAARVILINARGRDCRESVVLPGAAEVEIVNQVMLRKGLGFFRRECWSGRPGEPTGGIAVMAPGRAPAYFHGPVLGFLKERLFNLTVELRPRTQVIIDVWPASEEFALAAHDDLVNLDWILDRSLAGVALVPRIHPVNKEVAKQTCESPIDPAIYTPGSVNLYYGGNENNVSCPSDSRVLVHNLPVLGDAAHELGHRLGLIRSDTEADYPSGHTTRRPHFTCDNVMWEASKVLKSKLSLGQAFRIGLSCHSFLGEQSGCIPCSDTLGGGSPCPPYTLGVEEAATAEACAPCPLPGAMERLAGGDSLLCSRADLHASLSRRFDELTVHLATRPDLWLSTNDKQKFIDWWAPRIETVEALEAIATAKQQPNAAPVDDLLKQVEDGPMRDYAYVRYAADKIKKGTYSPRCGDSQLPKPSKGRAAGYYGK